MIHRIYTVDLVLMNSLLIEIYSTIQIIDSMFHMSCRHHNVHNSHLNHIFDVFNRAVCIKNYTAYELLTAQWVLVIIEYIIHVSY